MRQPWSPPWRTTMICGRSLPIARAEWRSGHIQACSRVLFILALVAARLAIYRSIHVWWAAGHGIDGRQWSDIGPDWV
jgi:hypothetical protein